MAQKPAETQESYGYWKCVYTTERGGFGGGTRKVYHVQCGSDESDRLEIGAGKEKRRLARTLAATMESAGATDFSILPPELGPKSYSDDEWESWAGDSYAIPAEVATASKAAIAGYLKVVHRASEMVISHRLDVGEQTVRQYLSDLREGRR